jgi:hypothetical protein
MELLARLDAGAKLRDPVRRHDELHTTISFAEYHSAGAVRTDIVNPTFPERCDTLRLLDGDAVRS